MITLTDDVIDFFDEPRRLSSKKAWFTAAKDMDIFQLCLVFGVHAILKNKNQMLLKYEDIPNKKGGFISGGYPADYSKKIYSSIGLVIISELNRDGYDLKNKERVKEFLDEILKYDDETKLTTKGQRLLTRYSYTGFILLREKMNGEKPVEKTIFLQEYFKFIKEFL